MHALSVVREIRCSHCGAPLAFNPGEIIVTCRYCGFTGVIETGEPFTLEHSMFLNEYDLTRIEDFVRQWMRSGFLKPGNLARRSKILEKSLVYLPFWVVSLSAVSQYKGIFERLTPPVMKEGKIEKKYNWLVLARRATKFPTKEYDVPLGGKVPYDFRKIERFAKVLNSEMDRTEAVELAKQQVEDQHRFLAQRDVDKIMEMKTDLSVGDSVYLHAPIWFILYEYRGERYDIIVDGATGTVIKGDIPSAGFSLF